MPRFDQEDSVPDTAASARKAPGRRASKGKTVAVLLPMDAASMALQDGERQLQMRALIQLGKERGYLTHAEINDHLPDNFAQTAAIETIVSTFNDMGVAVYEQAPDAEALLLNDSAPAAISDDQADEEAEVALSTVDSEFGRTTDPVRMYMREMGATELLTRAGEVEIAKRIEDGLHEMIQAIAACPATIATILASAEQVAAGELRIDELVDGLNERNAESDSSASDSATSRDVDTDTGDDVDADDDSDLEAADANEANEGRLRQLTSDSLAIFVRVGELFDQMPHASAKEAKGIAAFARLCKEIKRELAPIRFTARTIDRLCADVQQQVAHVRAVERRILQIAVDRCGMPREKFVESFPGHETDLNWTANAAASQEFGASLERSLPAIQAEQ